MGASRLLVARPLKGAAAAAAPSVECFNNYRKFKPNPRRVSEFVTHRVSSQIFNSSRRHASWVAAASARSNLNTDAFQDSSELEVVIEKAIYHCRFLGFLAVCGSLVGSILCFIKGCTYVGASFMEYLVNRGKVITLLVEAIDVYLLGTVMLVFGMGLYELFISNLDTSNLSSEEGVPHRSNLFGLFTLKERPRWLEIKTVSELKTKLGHVIVMLLLIGLFDKSKRALIHTPVDLLCFSASLLLSSGSLFLLAKLND